MPTFKNISIKKKGGGTRKQRVQVLASGKYKFVKNVKSSGSAGTRSKRRKGNKRMAKSKKRGGGGRKILGTIGFKGLIASVASLAILRIGLKKVAPQVPGEYVDSAAMMGAGVVGKVAKIGTAHMLAPGIVLGASKLIEDLVTTGGLVNLPGVGASPRGYDL